MAERHALRNAIWQGMNMATDCSGVNLTIGARESPVIQPAEHWAEGGLVKLDHHLNERSDKAALQLRDL